MHRSTDAHHAHVFWLPGDEDGDGLIDHITVWRGGGLPATFIATLARVEFFRIGTSRFVVEPHELCSDAAGGMFGPARIWRGATPYVTPRWRLTKTGKERSGFTPDAQIASELKVRGFPAPQSISWQAMAWVGDEQLMASAFVMDRRKDDKPELPPRDAVASFPTITFADPVSGPLAFGYGAHFGLGQLLPTTRFE